MPDAWPDSSDRNLENKSSNYINQIRKEEYHYLAYNDHHGA